MPVRKCQPLEVILTCIRNEIIECLIVCKTSHEFTMFSYTPTTLPYRQEKLALALATKKIAQPLSESSSSFQ